MTNYIASQGRRERNIRIAKRIIIVGIMLAIAGAWLQWSAKRDAEVMKIHYCWDANDQHYVTSSTACFAEVW